MRDMKTVPCYSITATCDEGVRSRLLLPPGRNKDSDVLVTTLQEPVDSQLDPLTGEDFLISVTAKTEK